MKDKIVIGIVFIVPLAIYFLLNLFCVSHNAANAENLPKVYVFSTPMCGECRKMAPVVEQAKKDHQDKINIVKIDATQRKAYVQKLVKQHKIYVVPTAIYINKEGKVVGRTEGSMTYEEFDKILKQVE